MPRETRHSSDVAYPVQVRFRRRQDNAPRVRRALLLMLTSIAVVLMHSAFGAHCASAAMPASHHGAPVAHHDAVASSDHRPTMGEQTRARGVDKASVADDCTMSVSCTFVLPGGAAIIVLAILIVIAYPPRELFARLVIARRVVLGRPPPWAIATHLQLGVLLR